MTLKDPEDYDKKYKEWKLEVLPIMPEKLQIKVIPQTGKQYRLVESLLNRQDVGEVVIAHRCRPGGELVARWILQKAGCRKPMKRLWISSVTDKAIREGFAHLRDAREYEHLYEAAHFPGGGGLAGGDQRDQGPDLQVQRPSFPAAECRPLPCP